MTQPEPQRHSHTQKHQPHLQTIPLELQLLILTHLPYPDLLSLKLTCRHFHILASRRSTVLSRVTWLLSRAQANLPIPRDARLQMRTDAMFLRNREVQRILWRRVRHVECAEAWRGVLEGGKKREKGEERWPGCLVVPGVELCEKGLEVLEGGGKGRMSMRMGQGSLRQVWRDLDVLKWVVLHVLVVLAIGFVAVRLFSAKDNLSSVVYGDPSSES